MGNVLRFILFFTLTQVTALAGDSYFLDQKKDCNIKLFSGGKFSDIDSAAFIKRTLDIKTLKKNPGMVVFKIDGNVYVTSADCVESVNLDGDYSAVPPVALAAPQSAQQDTVRVQPRPAKRKAIPAKTTFFEFDVGTFSISDQNQVSRDYNETFPSETTNPTTWSKAEKSKYKASLLLAAGFGFRQTERRSLVFKVRSLTGKKTDTLTLTDINSGLNQTGDWVYDDAFLNLYGGYRFHFFNSSQWRSTLSGYLGLSKTTTTLTDNSVTYNLSSLGLAVLLEGGVERMLGESFSLAGSIGFEFLGPRNLKFEEDVGTGKIKTKMSYNNTYLSLGIKYYF